MTHVWILTHSQDVDVPDRVAHALRQRGVTPVRVDTDNYPTDMPLSLGISPRGTAHIAGLPSPRAVYCRSLVSRPPEGMDPEPGRWVAKEAHHHWRAVLDSLDDRRLVNSPRANAAVEGHKARQLRVAARSGLAIPPTCITNRAEAARAFFDAQDGQVIAKLLHRIEPSLDGSAPHMPTQVITADHLPHLTSLTHGPLCFQRRIHAPRELRIAWVNGEAFVGAVETDAVDYRGGRPDAWQHGTLDPQTHAALGRLMDALGLVYGAIDLLLPEHGPPVFLEVNPSGEWGMLEAFLGLPVADALARALLEAP